MAQGRLAVVVRELEGTLRLGHVRGDRVVQGQPALVPQGEEPTQDQLQQARTILEQRRSLDLILPSMRHDAVMDAVSLVLGALIVIALAIGPVGTVVTVCPSSMLVTEVVPHDELLPTARRIATTIVGNNQKAVRALLDSYHHIDAEQTQAGLWIEAESARAWMATTTGDDIAASRGSVIERGRSQV